MKNTKLTSSSLPRRGLIKSALAAPAVFTALSAEAQLFGKKKEIEFKQFSKHNMLAGRSFKGQPAPAIEFEEWVANAPANTTGKPIMLKFFATTCPVCRASAPVLNKLHAEIGDRITFIALSREGAGIINAKYVKRYKLDYPVARDSEKRLYKTYEMREAYPHYVIIDTNGIVTYEGIMPYTQYERMRDRIIQKAKI